MRTTKENEEKAKVAKSQSVAKTSKGEKKRLAILAAARQCFEQHGYSRTTMDDIAKACRTVKSSLFYYYDSKESLFYHSFTLVWEENLGALLDKARAGSPVETRIQDYIRSSVDYYQEVVEKFGTSVSVLIETEELFEEILSSRVEDKIIDFYQEALEEGEKQGIFIKTDARKLATLICRTEGSFRMDAFRAAFRTGQARVDFKALSDDVCFVVDGLIRGLYK